MVRSPDAAGQVRNVETMADSHDTHDTHDTHEIKGNRDLREIPVKMLRGLFSGIGQLLLAADRFRAEDAQREGINHDGLIGPPTGLDGEPAAQQMKTVDHVKSAADSGETATSARGRHRKPAGATTAGRSGSTKKHASNATPLNGCSPRAPIHRRDDDWRSKRPRVPTPSRPSPKRCWES